MLVFSHFHGRSIVKSSGGKSILLGIAWLISNRRHQTILGTFLAMILYNIITVMGPSRTA
jgi:multisubunit Na+/H+ antiporter MnhG subunit